MKLTLLNKGNYFVETPEKDFIVSRKEDYYTIDCLSNFPNMAIGISSNLIMAIQLISDYLYGNEEVVF